MGTSSKPCCSPALPAFLGPPPRLLALLALQPAPNGCPSCGVWLGKDPWGWGQDPWAGGTGPSRGSVAWHGGARAFFREKKGRKAATPAQPPGLQSVLTPGIAGTFPGALALPPRCSHVLHVRLVQPNPGRRAGAVGGLKAPVALPAPVAAALDLKNEDWASPAWFG